MVRAQPAACSRAHACRHQPPHASPFPTPPKIDRRQAPRRARLGHASVGSLPGGAGSAARLPSTWGRSPRSPASGAARAGTRGRGAPGLGACHSGARFRLARPPGGPGWVLSVPSAFRKGDSATRSRVEKLRKTKNEVGRSWGVITLSQRRGRGLEPPGPQPPLPRNPARGGEGSAAAAVPWSRDAGTRAAAGGGGSVREREGQIQPTLPSSSPPPPPFPVPLQRRLRSKPGLGAWKTRDAGRCSQRAQPWREVAAEKARAASPVPRSGGRFNQARRAAALNLGVWWETEAQGREDLAVQECVVRNLACSRVPLFLPAPQAGAAGGAGPGGGGIDQKAWGRGEGGQPAGFFILPPGPSGREVKGKALWPRFQCTQWFLCAPCRLFPCPPHLHGHCSAPPHSCHSPPGSQARSLQAGTDLQPLCLKNRISPASHPSVWKAQERELGKSRTFVAL